MATAFILNDTPVSLALSPDTPLLYALREGSGQYGPRFGCGLGQCGACSVLLDGVAKRSCILPLEAVRGKSVTTPAGLGSRERPHPVQQAFVEEQAMQCGYCAGGIMIAAAGLLAENPTPDTQAIRRALDGHLCRCGTHTRIVRAVAKAAERAARMQREKDA